MNQHEIKSQDCRGPAPSSRRTIPLYNKQPSHPIPSTPTPSSLNNLPINPPDSYYFFPELWKRPAQQIHYTPSQELKLVFDSTNRFQSSVKECWWRKDGTISIFVPAHIENCSFDCHPDWFGGIGAVVKRQLFCCYRIVFRRFWGWRRST